VDDQPLRNRLLLLAI